MNDSRTTRPRTLTLALWALTPLMAASTGLCATSGPQPHPTPAALGAASASEPVSGPAALRARALETDRAGHADAAEPLYREAIVTAWRILGGDHEETLLCMHAFALSLERQERLGAAAPLLREAVAGRRRRLGDGHADTRASIAALARVLAARVEATRSAEDPIALGLALYEQGSFELALSDGVAAEPRLAEAVAILSERLAEDDARRWLAASAHGQSLALQGRLRAAEPALRYSAERILELVAAEDAATTIDLRLAGVFTAKDAVERVAQVHAVHAARATAVSGIVDARTALARSWRGRVDAWLAQAD